MSQAAPILDAVAALVAAAVSGVTISRQPQPIAAVSAALPHAVVALTDYAAEALEFSQERRTYRIAVTLAFRRAVEPPDYETDGDRETAAAALEALAAALVADRTLGGAAPEGAHLETGTIVSHPDEPLVFADLVVAAVRIGA